MWYMIIAGCLIVGVFFTSRLRSCNTPSQSENITSSINSSDNISDTIKGMFSRKQIDLKLKNLAETTPPTNLSYGAKCYSKAYFNNNVFEYICPVCGEKTIYKKKNGDNNFFLIENILAFDLEICRKQIEKVKGINILLDESEFCNKCKPNKKNPSLCLKVNIAGQTDSTRVCNITSRDIILLQEFLTDKLIHKGEYDEEYPLVKYSVRIKELLGIK
jgi:hypothetical protein